MELKNTCNYCINIKSYKIIDYNNKAYQFLMSSPDNNNTESDSTIPSNETPDNIDVINCYKFFIYSCMNFTFAVIYISLVLYLKFKVKLRFDKFSKFILFCFSAGFTCKNL